MGDGKIMAAPRDEPHGGLTPERWQRIKDVLAVALELEPEDRPTYLDEACSADSLLRSEVESLLSFDKDGSIAALEPPGLHLALRPGTMIREYEIVELLGAGGMGEVYRAHDRRLGRDVAIKVLPSFVSNRTEWLGRFEEEARAAAALNHPNILSVFQMGTHEGAPYLVSELLEGSNLREKIRNGPPSLQDSVNYGLQICRGLEAAHEKGVVHRDIKPENIFITTDNRVKILDFGLAKLVRGAKNATLVRAETQPEIAMGTAGYMSPEQVHGQSADPRSDIFAFGSLLYEMLGGKRAFSGNSPADVMNAILYKDPPNLTQAEIPNALNVLVKQCLEKDPERRYQSVAELISTLDSAGHADNLQNSGRRFGVRVWLAIVTAAMFTAVAGVTYFFERGIRHTGTAPSLQVSDSESTVLPLIGLPGILHMPAISPDGGRVAFLWMAPDAKKSGIYVAAVGKQGLLRLTKNIADYSPAWTPDGQQIAFLRDVGDHFSVRLVPSLGGVEREIHVGQRSQAGNWEPENAGLSFSPDGKFLAFSELNAGTQQDSIRLISLADSRVRAVTDPPEGFQDRYPVFSPMGDSLAFIRSAGRAIVDELYITPLTGGDAKKLTFDHHHIYGPPAFSQDGSEIVFSSNRAGLESLWRISARGGNLEAVSRSGPLEWYPSISLGGHALAFEYSDDEQNIWQIDLKDETHSKGPAKILIPAANAYNFLPQFSPDGRRIAFQSNRSGYSEIWICDADGSNLVQLTNLHSLTGSPRWSPEGRYIAFDSRPNQHSEVDDVEVDVSDPQPHLIAQFHDADAFIPTWSRDGKWIYFSSNRGGKEGAIWKVAIENGVVRPGLPIQMTGDHGFSAVESSDRRLFYYRNPPHQGIWAIPRDRPKQIAVRTGPVPDLWSNWALSNHGVYFLIPGHLGPEIEFLDFRTRLVSHIAKLDKPSFYGLAISPNGKSLIFSQQDKSQHQIFVMSGFR